MIFCLSLSPNKSFRVAFEFHGHLINFGRERVEYQWVVFENLCFICVHLWLDNFHARNGMMNLPPRSR